MGFGPLFLGVMLLYDFQIVRTPEGSQAAYAVIDLFPDLIGWILIWFGLRALSKHLDGLDKLRAFPAALFALSIFDFAKGTLLFSRFFAPDGTQSLVGESLDLCVHLFELLFLFLLFRKTEAFCRGCKDHKLASSHALVPRIVMTEGVLFLLAKIGAVFSLQGIAAQVFAILSKLDFIFWVFLVWFAAIALFRAMMRLSD